MASNGSNGQGEARSGGSSSKKVRKNVGKAKGPKVCQRGMGIAQLEQLRIQSQMEAAAALAANVSAGTMVPTNLHNVPVYQLLDEGPRVNDSFYLSSVLASIPPSFTHTPVTAPPAAGPQGVKENLSIFDCWKTSTPSRSHGPQSKKVQMSMAGEGSDIQLGQLNTSRLDEKEDHEFQQPNYFTRLLLADDEEEETGQKNKKARTDISSGEVSGAPAAGSSSSQGPNLELRLSF
ncbi:hypothetical protein POM88_024368 [Heracleum sosnowskyi]|uniref:Uncharacterized protein n=1 Tax=Heracleum sosnowskyi TaxID=360622 RepID=A0AAD8I354_9APIA|nr:hypothetical protein POM88_024368 [Heracleum sosnowskyi]